MQAVQSSRDMPAHSCTHSSEHFIPGLPVLPTQLFEAGANLLLFGALFLFYRKFGRGTTALYLIGYAIIRFGMEYLRGDPRAAVGPFSISQTISLALFSVGIVLRASLRKKA